MRQVEHAPQPDPLVELGVLEQRHPAPGEGARAELPLEPVGDDPLVDVRHVQVRVELVVQPARIEAEGVHFERDPPHLIVREEALQHECHLGIGGPIQPEVHPRAAHRARDGRQIHGVVGAR